MRDIYEKLTEDSSEDQPHMDVVLILNVDGLGDGETAAGPETVPLAYDIEVDWRSWGIKDINVAPRGEIEFEAELIDVDDNVMDTITINLEFEAIEVDLQWIAGHSYVPESIEIRTDRSGKVLGVELNFYFQSQ